MAPGDETTIETKHGIVALAGRVLLAVIFLLSGLEKLGNWDATASQLAAKEIQMVPFVLTGVVILEIAGSLSVLLGLKARAGAIALLFFLVPTTLVMHNFWELTGADRQMQMIQFMKNLSILGGLFLVIAFGPGRISLDGRMRPKRPRAGEARTDA